MRLLISLFSLIFILISPDLCLNAQALPDPGRIPYDLCENAWKIKPGDTLRALSNQYATVGPVAQIPAVLPNTCIKTFENDLWFEFITTEDYDFYEVEVTYLSCNTPAGLQAMIIRTDGCNARDFKYMACVNFESMDTMRLILQENTPGLRHLVHVDGFDGTICEFNLSFRGRKQIKACRRDLRYMRYTYDLKDEPVYQARDLGGKFMNNNFTLKWTSTQDDNVDYFLVEEVKTLENGEKTAELLKLVEPKDLVSGGKIHYQFQDTRPVFSEGADYCYRIVRQDKDGKRQYSENVCVKASLVTGFFVNEVEKSPEKGKFTVHYLNQKEGQSYKLSVLNEQMNPVKQFTLKKEPYRDGTITLDMSSFPPGTYFFKMDSGKGWFLREFLVEEN